MACQCGSNRILRLQGKCSDCSSTRFDGMEREGYVPCIDGLGHGDYIDVKVCMDCSRVQNLQKMTDEEIKVMMEDE